MTTTQQRAFHVCTAVGSTTRGDDEIGTVRPQLAATVHGRRPLVLLPHSVFGRELRDGETAVESVTATTTALTSQRSRGRLRLSPTTSEGHRGIGPTVMSRPRPPSDCGTIAGRLARDGESPLEARTRRSRRDRDGSWWGPESPNVTHGGITKAEARGGAAVSRCRVHRPRIPGDHAHGPAGQRPPTQSSTSGLDRPSSCVGRG